MKSFSRRCALVFASLARFRAGVNLTGKWVLDVQTDAGSGTPTVTLKQDGEKLTGHYSGQLGEADVTGSVKGNEFTFVVLRAMRRDSSSRSPTRARSKRTR